MTLKRCFPPNADGVIKLKAEMLIKVPLEVLILLGCDFDKRKEWEDVLTDLRVFSKAADLSYTRLAYTFGSPWPASDRDFYLEQLIRKDFPKQGLTSIMSITLPMADEYPAKKGTVRAKLNIQMILEPFIDAETGLEYCNMVLANQCDICGMVPKWLTNAFAKSVPVQWCR
jgi:hypothetical protein